VRSWLSCIIAALMACPPAAEAQAPPQPPPVKSTTLRVVPLAGNGAVNDMERRIMSPLVVQVLDQESRPVEGAQVVFRFPLNGPGATFANGELAQTTRTNADGQAAATGWMANSTAGAFEIHVTATRNDEIGQAVISMTNATRVVDDLTANKGKSSSKSKWIKIAIVAGVAGAVTGIVLATTHGGSGGGTTVTAAPGTPTIGAP
jgi:hypothetical protein